MAYNKLTLKRRTKRIVAGVGIVAGLGGLALISRRALARRAAATAGSSLKDVAKRRVANLWAKDTPEKKLPILKMRMDPTREARQVRKAYRRKTERIGLTAFGRRYARRVRRAQKAAAVAYGAANRTNINARLRNLM